MICRWYAAIYGSQWTPEERPSDLHPLPNPGAGEGVLHKSLHHKASKDWNGPWSSTDWETAQDLVSKSKNEAKKGDHCHQGAQWARTANQKPILVRNSESFTVLLLLSLYKLKSQINFRLLLHDGQPFVIAQNKKLLSLITWKYPFVVD